MKLRVRSRLEGYMLCFKQLYVHGLTFCPCERSVVRHHFPFHLSTIEVEIVVVIALMKQKDIRSIPKSDPNTCLFLVGTLQKESTTKHVLQQKMIHVRCLRWWN